MRRADGSEDLVHIHGNGQIDDRSTYLNGVASKFVFHAIERGDLTIRQIADTVIVVGPVETTVQVRGQDELHHLKGLASQTWVRGEDGWRQHCCHMLFF